MLKKEKEAQVQFWINYDQNECFLFMSISETDPVVLKVESLKLRYFGKRIWFYAIQKTQYCRWTVHRYASTLYKIYTRVYIKDKHLSALGHVRLEFD